MGQRHIADTPVIEMAQIFQAVIYGDPVLNANKGGDAMLVDQLLGLVCRSTDSDLIGMPGDLGVEGID